MPRPVHLWLRAESKENEQRTHLTPEKCQELIQAGELVSLINNVYIQVQNVKFEVLLSEIVSLNLDWIASSMLS